MKITLRPQDSEELGRLAEEEKKVASFINTAGIRAAIATLLELGGISSEIPPPVTAILEEEVPPNSIDPFGGSLQRIDLIEALRRIVQEASHAI